MPGKHNLKFHIILVTKYRNSALAELKEEVFESFRYVEELSDFSIIAMGVEKGNHAHLVVQIPSNYPVASVVRRLKQISTHYLWNRYGVFSLRTIG